MIMGGGGKPGTHPAPPFLSSRGMGARLQCVPGCLKPGSRVSRKQTVWHGEEALPGQLHATALMFDVTSHHLLHPALAPWGGVGWNG